uniref:Uncharacterized protein n=1 Tax=Strongyloides stercoralis TaxID=6248 RepID=A0AAF5DK01_STRER
EDETFVPDTVFDNESNFAETASENDDKKLFSNDENPIDNKMNNTSNSINEYIRKNGTIWKAEPYKTGRTKRHNLLKGNIHKVVLPPGKIITILFIISIYFSTTLF